MQTLTDRSRLQVHLPSRIGDKKRLSPYVPSLPPNETVVNVLADYLCYLKKCVRKYIDDTQINGAGLWTALESSEEIRYVLAHSNGWEGSEESWMRKAAVQLDSRNGHEYISFVTEGEANFHFAIKMESCPKSQVPIPFSHRRG